MTSWVNMLACIPTVSRTEALAIARVYPTPGDLVAALQYGHDQAAMRGLHPAVSLLFATGPPSDEEQWMPIIPEE